MNKNLGVELMEQLSIKIPTPYEPKRCNRWLVKLLDILQYIQKYVKNTERPSWIIDESGYVTYNPITIDIYDPIGPSIAQELFQIMIGVSSVHDKYAETNEDVKRIKDEYGVLKNGFDYILELLYPNGIATCKMTIQPESVILRY